MSHRAYLAVLVFAGAGLLVGPASASQVRQLSAQEVKSALEYIRLFPGKPDDEGGRLLAWTSFCRALVASNDFLYVR